MFTVRFPTGVAVVYNDANYLYYRNSCMELYTQKDGRWICSIPNSTGCIVESMPACRVENAVMDLKKAAGILSGSRARLQECASSDLARLKRQLQSFNRKTLRWKS